MFDMIFLLEMIIIGDVNFGFVEAIIHIIAPLLLVFKRIFNQHEEYFLTRNLPRHSQALA